MKDNPSFEEEILLYNGRKYTKVEKKHLFAMGAKEKKDESKITLLFGASSIDNCKKIDPNKLKADKR